MSDNPYLIETLKNREALIKEIKKETAKYAKLFYKGKGKEQQPELSEKAQKIQNILYKGYSGDIDDCTFGCHTEEVRELMELVIGCKIPSKAPRDDIEIETKVCLVTETGKKKKKVVLNLVCEHPCDEEVIVIKSDDHGCTDVINPLEDNFRPATEEEIDELTDKHLIEFVQEVEGCC